ncbi:polysaccharide pyruvyl transferase family protein, partial [bacterium]|nr:polysaccharide pyruvyl transferase family protein [bacterium]
MTKARKNSQATLILNCFGPSNRGDYELLRNFLAYINTHSENKRIYFGVANSVTDCNHCFPDINWLSRFGSEKSEKLSRLSRLITSSYYYFWLTLSTLLRIDPGFLCHHVSQLVRIVRISSRIYSCPGGYLEDSGIAYILSIIYILHAARWKNRNCRIVLAPMSIGPIKSFFGKFLIKRMLSSCDLVCLRERWSLAFCDRLIQRKDVKANLPEIGLYPDFAAIMNVKVSGYESKISYSDDYYLSRAFIDQSLKS